MPRWLNFYFQYSGRNYRRRFLITALKFNNQYFNVWWENRSIVNIETLNQTLRLRLFAGPVDYYLECADS
jgi:hypothetical protein